MHLLPPRTINLTRHTIFFQTFYEIISLIIVVGAAADAFGLGDIRLRWVQQLILISLILGLSSFLDMEVVTMLVVIRMNGYVDGCSIRFNRCLTPRTSTTPMLTHNLTRNAAHI